MTLNLTELRDEPLGKHPSHVDICVGCISPCLLTEAQQDVVAADDESSFTFDVEGLGDEALDPSDLQTQLCACNPGGACAGSVRSGAIIA